MKYNIYVIMELGDVGSEVRLKSNQIFMLIQNAITKYNNESEIDEFYVYRKDTIKSDKVMDGVINTLKDSSIIIAVLSNSNSVYYELGYAHALKIPVVIMSENNNISYDISAYRRHIFSMENKNDILHIVNKSLNSIVVRSDIFISYSHKDIELLNEFKVFLKPLVRDGILTYWDDSKIITGSKWLEEIEIALKKARIAIFFVSPDFLASDFIMNKEVPKLLLNSESEGIKIFWIPCSTSLYKRTQISEYQSAIDPDCPLDTMAKPQRNIAFTQICNKLCDLIK